MRRHLSYANVVATLALVFAMGGSAVAAKHYLLSSTKQIKPSLLKQLRKAGPRGATGPVGATGSPGATGPSGASAGPPTGLGGGVLLTEPIVGVKVSSDPEHTVLFKFTNSNASTLIDVQGIAELEGEQVKAWQTKIGPGESAFLPAFAAQTHYLDVVVTRAGETVATSPMVHITCAVGADGSFIAGCIAVH